jgi:hypothetical protein
MDVIEVVCGGLAMAGRVSQGCTWGFPEALKKKLDHPGQELTLGGGEGRRYRMQHAWWGHGGAPARVLTRARRRFGIPVGLLQKLRRGVCGGE